MIKLVFIFASTPLQFFPSTDILPWPCTKLTEAESWQETLTSFSPRCCSSLPSDEGPQDGQLCSLHCLRKISLTSVVTYPTRLNPEVKETVLLFPINCMEKTLYAFMPSLYILGLWIQGIFVTDGPLQWDLPLQLARCLCVQRQICLLTK